MSILYSSDKGWYISHECYINKIYNECTDYDVLVNSNLFEIKTVYKPNSVQKKSKCKYREEQTKYDESLQEIHYLKTLYESFRQDLEASQCFTSAAAGDFTNTKALEAANLVYKLTENVPTNLLGGNASHFVINTLEGAKYVFPQNCKFFSKNVQALQDYISDKYDLVLMDPPWWNKYIRRKRKAGGSSYNMMHNDDLKSLPIEAIIKDDGLVVVWCTNSSQNLETLTNQIFEKWGIQFIAKWYWLKVTQSGEPICQFSDPSKKQPYEQIIFGCKSSRILPKPPNGKIVVSVPSALHSHKPPLIELLKPYLRENPDCLELFARYLLPGWTSYGLEVLKFQHESLFNINQKR